MPALLLVFLFAPSPARADTPSAAQCEATTSAGTALVAEGMALLAEPHTAAIGMALIAAGMSLIASGTACVAQVAAEKKAAEEAAAKEAAEKLAAEEKAKKEEQARDIVELDKPKEAAESIMAEDQQPGIRKELAVEFSLVSYADCVADFGGRSELARARVVLPDGFKVDTYCRRLFPTDVNPGTVKSTLKVVFTFESNAQCVEATTSSIKHADGTVLFPENGTAEAYCNSIFPGEPAALDPETTSLGTVQVIRVEIGEEPSRP